MTLATLTGLGSTTDTTFDDHTAVAGVVYYYSVRACNSHGCSEDSLQNPGYARTGDVMRLFLPAIMR